MKNPLKNGTLIAFAAASLFATACKSTPAGSTLPSSEKTAAVHCMGINGCKGQGACKTAANACAGQNACKGQGYVDSPSADACTDAGGTVLASM